VTGRDAGRTVLVGLLALATAAGCAALGREGPPDRATVISRIVAVTAKVVVERDGQRIGSASGVVVASRAGRAPVSYVLTAWHVLEGKQDAALFVRLPGASGAAAKLKAELVRAGDPSLDLALLRVPGVQVPPAILADPPDGRLGEEILVAGFPWGKRLALFGGIVSQVPGQGGEVPAEERSLVVDAAAANGVSGGGVFREATGVLLGVVEGFQTASIAVEGRTRAYSVKVPLPGETFVVPADRIREFLRAAGQ
jgi:S1-C subfamily serine protease